MAKLESLSLPGHSFDLNVAKILQSGNKIRAAREKCCQISPPF
jgi:hypothetical protein